ncbi:MAG TPA: type II secretion system protein GspG [Gemmataceae bacterium]|jgi:general secretion pathway protein G|nr:type II secretion system protein GspG [Gemmataceae bacterium]
MIIRQQQPVSRCRTAFTLMEVLVVVAIILILASVGGIFVFRYLDQAKEDMAKAGTKSLETGCNAYKLKYGEYPPNLQQLIQPPDGAPFVEPAALNDPWGRPYQYDPNGAHNNKMKPDIWTIGTSGQELGNWAQ